MFVWALFFCVLPLLNELRIWCLARDKYRVVRLLADEEQKVRKQASDRIAKYWDQH